MKRLRLPLTRVYPLAAMLVVVAALAAWAVWGSPSTLSLVWVAAVGAGLVIAIALAVRDGSPTRSITHVLYDAEHPLGDAPGDAPPRATAGVRR